MHSIGIDSIFTVMSHKNLAISINWNCTVCSTTRLAPSKCESSLQSNAASHWLGANLESVLHTYIYTVNNVIPLYTRQHSSGSPHFSTITWTSSFHIDVVLTLSTRSPTSRRYIQKLVLMATKTHSNFYVTGYLWGKTTADRGDYENKWIVCGTNFHGMTFSCSSKVRRNWCSGIGTPIRYKICLQCMNIRHRH